MLLMAQFSKDQLGDPRRRQKLIGNSIKNLPFGPQARGTEALLNWRFYGCGDRAVDRIQQSRAPHLQLRPARTVTKEFFVDGGWSGKIFLTAARTQIFLGCRPCQPVRLRAYTRRDEVVIRSRDAVAVCFRAPRESTGVILTCTRLGLRRRC